MASQLVGQERQDFWLVCFGQLFTFCGFFAFFQFPLYIEAVGGSEQAVGLIMGATSLASTLLLPWITAMTERMERKGMMLAGIVLVELSTMATIFTSAPDVWMAGLMVLRGLGMAVFMNGAGAYVAQILPAGERSRWIGVNFGFNQVATALGPLLAEIAIRTVGFPYFFFMCTAFVYAGLMMIVAVRRRDPPAVDTPFRPLASLTVFLGEIAGPRMRTPFLALVLMAGALGAVVNFTATFTAGLGLSSGLFFANYALINAVSRFGGAGLADRYGRSIIVVPMLLLFGAGLYLFSFTTATWMMLVSGLLIGVGFGLSNPALLALMLDRAPAHLQGRAIGVFHFAYQSGFLVMPPIFGAIAEHAGYRPMWWVAGLFPFAALAVYLIPVRQPPDLGEALPAAPPAPASRAAIGPAAAAAGAATPATRAQAAQARAAQARAAQARSQPQARQPAQPDARTRAAQAQARRPQAPPRARPQQLGRPRPPGKR